MPTALIPTDTSAATCFRPEDLPSIAPGGIVSQTLLRAGGGKVLTFQFAAGQSLSEHTNPNQALLLPLQGSLEVRAGGNDYRLSPGDVLHFPPSLPHAVSANKPASFVLVLLTP
jgi:quercetin dioxygenase-like cupin family protein